jgi:flagellar biogenesis protein FliO
MSGNGAAGASYGDLLITSLVVLAGVSVAAFVVVRLVGRWLATPRSGGGDVMAVVARLPLEPRRSLYVVDVAGKTLLVGTSEMGLSLLSELDGAAVRSRAVVQPSFGALVRAAWQRRPVLRERSLDGDELAAGVDPGAAAHEADGSEASVRREGVAPESREPIAGGRRVASGSVVDAGARRGDAR